MGEVVKKGAQAGPSTLAIDANIFDPGDNDTEAVLHDILNGSGYFASDWTTTGNANSDYTQFTVKLTLSAAHGGKTYTLNKAHAQDTYTITASYEGLQVNAVFESNDAKVTIS